MENNEIKRDLKEWLKVYTDNYEGKSKIAQSLKDYVKQTYTDASYIPWATMERITYMLDPEAQFINITNASGGMVHTDVCNNYMRNGDENTITDTTMFSHMVRVGLQFMGKYFEEDYPIQDSKNEPVRNYTQNDVNNSLKRALAKVAAKATGIGLKLYENKDLQFAENLDNKKPELKPKETKETKASKITEKVEPLVETSIEVEKEVTEKPQEVIEKSQEVIKDKKGFDKTVEDIIRFIKDNDENKVVSVLSKVNTAVIKKYNFALDVNDDENTLGDKLSQFPEPTKFLEALKNLLVSENE